MCRPYRTSGSVQAQTVSPPIRPVFRGSDPPAFMAPDAMRQAGIRSAQNGSTFGLMQRWRGPAAHFKVANDALQRWLGRAQLLRHGGSVGWVPVRRRTASAACRMSYSVKPRLRDLSCAGAASWSGTMCALTAASITRASVRCTASNRARNSATTSWKAGRGRPIRLSASRRAFTRSFVSMPNNRAAEVLKRSGAMQSERQLERH